MNATLFGKRVFADGSKLRTFETRGSSWIILVGLKSSDECPYRRHRGDGNDRGGGREITEAEMGVTQIWATVGQGLPATPQTGREAQSRFPPEAGTLPT